ncbi:hypothetical protein C0991_002907, partial [Blastosporella zonata]
DSTLPYPFPVDYSPYAYYRGPSVLPTPNTIDSPLAATPKRAPSNKTPNMDYSPYAYYRGPSVLPTPNTTIDSPLAATPKQAPSNKTPNTIIGSPLAAAPKRAPLNMTPNTTISSPLAAAPKRAPSNESLRGLCAKKSRQAKTDKENHCDTAESFSDSDDVEITDGWVSSTGTKNPTAKLVLKGKKEASNNDGIATGLGPRYIWTTIEKTALFDYLMGPDADQHFGTLKVNAKKVFKKAATELFNGKFKPQAVKSQYERSLKTFGHILAYRNVTGGGGDADEQNKSDDEDDLEDLKKRIEQAKANGRNIATLTAKTLAEWYKEGWHGKSPKVVRPVIRNSTLALSDADDNLAGSDGSDSEPVVKKRTLVSETKYKKPAAAARSKSLISGTGINTYFENRVKLDESRLRIDEKRLQAAEDREKAAAQREKAELAKALVCNPQSSAALIDAANDYLIKLFQSDL